MRRAITMGHTSLVPQTTLVPVTEREAAAEFSAVVIPFSAGELARAAKRSKEAAKAWKEGRSLPSGWSLFNMAREIPAVRNWMLAKLGPSFQEPSPQAVSMAVLAFQTLLATPGPDGDVVRAAVARAAGAKDAG